MLSTYKAIILSDKGYIGDELAKKLASSKGVELWALKRNNSKKPYPTMLRNCISKHRRRIETSFAKLVEQFQINEVLANSIDELKVRMQSQILGHNISYFMNRCLGNKSSRQIKQLIFG